MCSISLRDILTCFDVWKWWNEPLKEDWFQTRDWGISGHKLTQLDRTRVDKHLLLYNSHFCCHMQAGSSCFQQFRLLVLALAVVWEIFYWHKLSPIIKHWKSNINIDIKGRTPTEYVDVNQDLLSLTLIHTVNQVNSMSVFAKNWPQASLLWGDSSDHWATILTHCWHHCCMAESVPVDYLLTEKRLSYHQTPSVEYNYILCYSLSTYGHSLSSYVCIISAVYQTKSQQRWFF